MDEKKRGLLVWDLGLCDYQVAYQHQKDLVERKRRDPSTLDTLILVEHPEVYTYGRKSLSFPLHPSLSVIEVERGGEITYHNPGQLVAYPILSLGEKERDLHAYLRRLEETVIDTLGYFEVEAERKKGATGVWIKGKEKKIASIGIAVSSWVTYHGIALNVENDLSGFHRIHPCGFSPEVITSLTEEKRSLFLNGALMDRIKARFITCFLAQFGRWIPG